MTDLDSFDRQMSRFANALRQKAEKDATPLEEATNAFKALTTYYAILRKYPITGDGEADTTFDDLQQEMREVVAEEDRQNGSGSTTSSVRSRSRRN